MAKVILVHGYACGIDFWKFLPAKPNGGFNGYTNYLKNGECVLFYWSQVVTKFSFWESANPLKIRKAYRTEQNWASSAESAKRLDLFFCQHFGILVDSSNIIKRDKLIKDSNFQDANSEDRDSNNSKYSFAKQALEVYKNQSEAQNDEVDSSNILDKNIDKNNQKNLYDKKIIAHSTGCRLVLNWLKRSENLAEFLKHQTLEIDLFNPEFEVSRCLEDSFEDAEAYKSLKAKNKTLKRNKKQDLQDLDKNLKATNLKTNSNADLGTDLNINSKRVVNSANFLIDMIDKGRLKINLHYCPWDQTLWLSPMYNYYFPAGIFGSKSKFFENKISPMWQWNLNFHVASINSTKVADKTMKGFTKS
jgi:hypothetical protein